MEQKERDLRFIDGFRVVSRHRCGKEEMLWVSNKEPVTIYQVESLYVVS